MAVRDDARTEPRAPLTRDRVLRSAIALADGEGIEALTMRKLARSLGVEAMSLYNHVANKGDLVDGMVDLVVSEIELPSAGKEWDEAIRAYAVFAHEAFLRHPWACNLVMGTTSTQGLRAGRLQYMEWLLRQLREAGFSPELAYHGYHALDSHILGFTLWQLGHAAAAQAFADEDVNEVATKFLRELRGGGYPYLAEHGEQHLAAGTGEGAREFEFGLDLILDGLRRALADAARVQT